MPCLQTIETKTRATSRRNLHRTKQDTMKLPNLYRKGNHTRITNRAQRSNISCNLYFVELNPVPEFQVHCHVTSNIEETDSNLYSCHRARANMLQEEIETRKCRCCQLTLNVSVNVSFFLAITKLTNSKRIGE
jgi:hypothetical protein